MELKQDTTITMESRLDKIEDKIDKLTDTMVSMARAEEKITALRTDQNKMYDRINRLSVKLDEIQYKVDENARTVNLINKLFWVAIVASAGAVASHMWM